MGLMKSKIRSILSVFLIVFSLSFATGAVSLLVAQPVLADTVKDIQDGVTGAGGNPATKKNSGAQIPVVIKTAINILLFFIGVFAVIMIVIAGIRFVTSNGDSNTVSSARNTIMYAVIGIVVAFMAFALVNFVVDRL